jgi:hypothetical protein
MSKFRLRDSNFAGVPGASIRGDKGDTGERGERGERGAPGLVWKGPFSPGATYNAGEVVSWRGESLVCLTDGTMGRLPIADDKYWSLLAAKGKEGVTHYYKQGSPRLAAALARLEEIESGGSVNSEAIFDSPTEAGMAVYISGDGHVDLALADNVDTATAVGIAIADVAEGQPGEYATTGPVVNPNWNLVPGSVYYLSPTTPGGLTATYPTTPGHFVVILGAAATPTQLNLEIHWMLEQS